MPRYTQRGAGAREQAAYLVLGEAHPEVHLLDLFGKEILLVQEKDNGGVLEPPVVDDIAEQVQRLVHPVHRFIVLQL